MQSAGNSFISALRWGTNIVAAQLVHYQNAVPTGIVLPVSDGQFTIDRNSEQRRQGQITVEVLPTIPPQTATDQNGTWTILPLVPTAHLAPFQNEISVQISIVQAGANGIPVAGANGWVPLGMYQIASTTVDDSGIDLTASLQLFDRSWAVAQRKFLAPYTVPAAAGDLQSETVALLNTAWGSTPPWTYNIQPNAGYTVPAGTYNQGQDPWQAILDIYQSAGYEAFFDVNGNFVGQPIPNPATSPVVWNFVEGAVASTGTFKHPISGTPYTTPVATSINMTRDGINNNFIVAATGPNNASGTAVPIQASAADNNPASPTYVNGPMGNSPNFIFDSLITTQAQAQAEANYDLAQSLAKSWTISVDATLNPLFDVDDVCSVTRPRLGLTNQLFVVDTVQTSIRYDALTTVSGRIVTL